MARLSARFRTRTQCLVALAHADSERDEGRQLETIGLSRDSIMPAVTQRSGHTNAHNVRSCDRIVQEESDTESQPELEPQSVHLDGARSVLSLTASSSR